VRKKALCLVVLAFAWAGCVDSKAVTGDAATDTGTPRDSMTVDSGCEGCISAGTCRTGDGVDSCGAAGSACIPCAAGEECADGVCRRPPSCDETNCSGCCDGDTCVTSPDDANCGGGGGECTRCTAPATCTSGVCVNPCDAMSCGGCCGEDGCVEVDDQTEFACGRMGAACDACAGGEECVDGACTDTTCAATCAGCCTGATCVDPASAASCGAMGSPCIDCGDGICESGMCALDPAATWNIIAVSGLVPVRDPDGDTWDSFGGLPDPLVEITIGATGAEQTGSTTDQPNTTEPAWNEQILSGVTSQDIIDGTTLTVFDVDPIGRAHIGACELTYTSADFPSVERWTCSPNPTGPGYAGWEVTLRIERAR